MLSLNKFINISPLKKNSRDDDEIELDAGKKDIVVVVKFRAPRVDHLVSIFH